MEVKHTVLTVIRAIVFDAVPIWLLAAIRIFLAFLRVTYHIISRIQLSYLL
jgi:hypothetical protein